MSESKIENELLEVAKLKSKNNEERQAYLSRLMRAVAKVSDGVWNELSTEAQDWNNNAAQAVQNGTDIQEFPDMEVEDEELEKEVPRGSCWAFAFSFLSPGTVSARMIKQP